MNNAIIVSLLLLQYTQNWLLVFSSGLCVDCVSWQRSMDIEVRHSWGMTELSPCGVMNMPKVKPCPGYYFVAPLMLLPSQVNAVYHQ